MSAARPFLRIGVVLLAVSTLGAVAAGCSGDKSGPTGTRPDTTATPKTPNPLTVRVTLDDSRATTARIVAREGGTVSVTGQGGTRFTLTIPGQALLKDQDITLTPVAAIDGLPLSRGLIGAVQLAPEGLRFLWPATLTIEAAGSLRAENVTAFGYHQTGAEFYLQPHTLAGSTVSIELMHFSGAGAGNGTAQDRAGQQQRVPTSPEDRVSQLEALDPTDAEITDILRERYASAVRPVLTEATTNADRLVPAALQYASWATDVNTISRRSRFILEMAEANVLLTQAVDNATRKALALCVDLWNPDALDKLDIAVVVANRFLLDVELQARDRLARCRPEAIEFKLESTFEAKNALFTAKVGGTAEGRLTPVGDGPAWFGDVSVDYMAPPGVGIPFTYTAWSYQEERRGDNDCLDRDAGSVNGSLQVILNPNPVGGRAFLMVMGNSANVAMEFIKNSCQDERRPSSYWFTWFNWARAKGNGFGEGADTRIYFLGWENPPSGTRQLTFTTPTTFGVGTAADYIVTENTKITLKVIPPTLP